jgi:Cysteine-rich secretory protein family
MKNKIKKAIKSFIILFLTSGLMFFTSIEMVIAKPLISEGAIFELVNEERIENDITPLILNNKLTQAAINKAKDLAKNNYFNHDSNEGKKFSTWIKETGYEYSFIGENLAKDFSNNESIIKAWLKSPGHRENILNDNFTETGIAVYNDIVVQIFGRPELLPLPIKETIGDHISENLILYLNENNKLIIHSKQNHLA